MDKIYWALDEKDYISSAGIKIPKDTEIKLIEVINSDWLCIEYNKEQIIVCKNCVYTKE